MFESILYAVLCTLKAEGVWGGEVREVAPGKVGPFWIGEEEKAGKEDSTHKKVRNSASAKVRNKGLKIDLVRGWLESGDIVGLGNGAVEETARAYMEKWGRVPGRKAGKKNGAVVEEGKNEMRKLDDLADSLLQGMAWAQWEENKKLAREHGVEALLER